jgi:hypothetical protein
MGKDFLHAWGNKMQRLPTEIHGLVDYLTAGMLLVLPRACGWRGNVRQLMTITALSTLAYSLLTRYELGLVKTLPVKAHLGLDGKAAAQDSAAALLLLDEETPSTAVLAGISAFEFSIVALSNPQPFQDDWANRALEDARQALSQRFDQAREGVQALGS